MPDVHQDIRAWLYTQPDWIQQAVDILLSSGGVSDADIKTLVERLKIQEGQQVTRHRTFDGLRPAPTYASDLRLLEIGDICGIENLGPRSPLSFGVGNLCVIYGHNGSGKSGYTRLLKRVCGKPRADELKPNVFQLPPTVRKCTIKYQVAGVLREMEWLASDAPIGDIRSVDIFDADAAVSYLTKETAASYTPPPVALFEALAAVCDRIRVQLQAEQDGLVSALPGLPSDYAVTTPGVAYRTMRPDLDESAIQRMIKWEDTDAKELERLSERLKVDDPAALAHKKRSTKKQLDQLTQLLEEAASAYSQERLAAIRALRTDALDKRRIATESVEVASARLEGIGTETWRALWGAARDYSQVAYPEREFPVTDEALCVLCHQELGRDAQRRLHDFEVFVRGKLEAAATSAEAVYQQAIEGLPTPLADDQIATRCQAAGLTQGEWQARIGDFWGQARKTREAILRGEVNEVAIPLARPIGILDELAKISNQLERDAAQHDQDAARFDRDQAGKDKLNLEARRWTAQQRAAIRIEIVRLKMVAQYEKWKKYANSSAISRKAGEIAQKVVTQELVDRFNRELRILGASQIKVELCKVRTEKGKALHKLRLKGARTGQNLPESVLSDGERRIVGLAAFLADVTQQPNSAPFIFDDPISSLDHEFEWRVAIRLAQLARSRQVLVFTHRLSLYGAMEDAANKIGDDWKQNNLHQRCIESFFGVAGHPAEQATWNAKTSKANNILLTRLDEAKRAGIASGAESYKRLAQGICSEFRKLLERTVEDDLLNQVVRRHRRSITTDNRLPSLTCITREDCAFIDGLMTKYSCYEHSQSQESPTFIPEEPELRDDLERLKSWRDEFKRRAIEARA